MKIAVNGKRLLILILTKDFVVGTTGLPSVFSRIALAVQESTF